MTIKRKEEETLKYKDQINTIKILLVCKDTCEPTKYNTISTTKIIILIALIINKK
jgi:hypothetical protein